MPNARENALNIASISWCVLPPRIKSICVVNLALITTALKNSSTNSVSNVPTFSLLNVALKDKYGRPHISLFQYMVEDLLFESTHVQARLYS